VIEIPKACRREIDELPGEIRGDLADALARLDAGQTLSMPLSRPMPIIGAGVHELRLKDRSGVYRILYALVREGTVHVLHAFKKTAQATPRRNIELAQRRLKDIKERTLKEAKR
jgi:phage-related protein